MLIFLQHIAARLGVVTGRSLAVNVRAHFPRPLVWLFGLSMVPALVATSLAEILGGALGFQILFHIPLYIGAPLTLALVVLAILGQRYDQLERLIVVFLAFIAAAYIIELFIVKPDMAAAAPALARAEPLGRVASSSPWGCSAPSSCRTTSTCTPTRSSRASGISAAATRPDSCASSSSTRRCRWAWAGS